MQANAYEDLEDVSFFEGAMIMAVGDDGLKSTMVDADDDLVDVMEEFFLLSPDVVKQSYATILKQGKKSTPPTRGYAATAAALSDIRSTTKVPPKKKRVPPNKRTTMDPNKLYLDSAATYHSMFVRWYLKNVRDAGRLLRGNCNAGVSESPQIGDLEVFEMWLNEGGIPNLLSIP